MLFNIFICLSLCFSAFGFFHSYLHRKGYDYVSHYLLVSAYFAGVSLIAAGIFWEYLKPVLTDYDTRPLLVFVAFFIGQIVFFIVFPKYVRAPKEYLEAHPDRFYLKLDIRRLLSKYTDIVAQQVFIVLLVVFLQRLGLSLFETILAFAALFSVLHIPLMIVEWGKWPMYVFAGAVLLFSALFPVLIIYVPWGFLYNIMVHWIFYIALAAIFWLRHEHQVQ